MPSGDRKHPWNPYAPVPPQRSMKRDVAYALLPVLAVAAFMVALLYFTR